MSEAPTTGQLILTFASATLFGAATLASILRSRERALAVLISVAGALTALGALVWHMAGRGSWLPLDDNFDALVWLALMVACVSIYLLLRRTAGRVDWALSPIVILLLLAAAIFGATMPQVYGHSAWAWTHRISVYTGPIALALAAATGVMYLVLNARLRNKHSTVDARFGSLEKLERITYTAVTVGFALLTVGLVTGVTRAIFENTNLGPHWYLAPKVILSLTAYALYALVLHSPINPAFRGRRTAILSIAGFVLLLATLGVVQIL